MSLQQYVRQVKPRNESYTPPVDKVQNFLTEGLKAEDYEAAVVMGWYEIHNRKLDSKTGIADKTFKTLEKSPDALETGRRIAQYILKNNSSLKGVQAEQYGRAGARLTSFWKGYGATDTTPKTDILIGNMRFSLKIGDAQLMSGGPAESMATFYAALENSDKELEKDPQFKKTHSIIESFVPSSMGGRNVAPGKVGPIIKSGENEIINKAEIAHKDCMRELGSLFDKSLEFKIAFAREAMSGYMKYGSSDNAAAEYMLVSNHSGTSVGIHNIDDDAYCEKIANRMKLQARFKTTQTKEVALRTAENPEGKTGKYKFWSVISLIVNAMDEAVIYDDEVLVEINLRGIVKKFKGFLSRTWKKVTKFFKGSVNNLMEFLDVKVDVKVERKINFD